MTMNENELKPDHLMRAAYGHVEKMVRRVDDSDRIMWHGWALRESFIAGTEWQKVNEQSLLQALILAREALEDIEIIGMGGIISEKAKEALSAILKVLPKEEK